MVRLFAAIAVMLLAVMLTGAAEGLHPSLPRLAAQTNPTPAQSAPTAGQGQMLGKLTATPPEVIYDLSLLPAPVARLREQIIEAARSGDIERLRPILDGNGITPVFSFGGDTDAIQFWKDVSGDGEGRELLAIMIEVFEAGFVRVKHDGPSEIYVWPYFAEVPLSGLSPEQQVELYKLVTAQDVKDMEEFGAYIFYRAGITPDGQWQFFVAGD
ncbi:MAG: hypothetical protein Q8P46_09400 [Hyphomicrobiales bacterium]|nr:hypothetical protein [Hyphomicrobiales bacterium]